MYVEKRTEGSNPSCSAFRWYTSLVTRQRKYTKEVLEPHVKNSKSVADVMRSLDLRFTGSTYSLICKRIKEYELDTSHFIGQAWRRDRTFDNEAKPYTHYLVQLEPGSRKTDRRYLKKALIQSGVEYVCENGHAPEWMGKPLRLHIDHIDGNILNNLKENLRFLCPNCHDLTDTWGRTKSA